MKIEDIVVGKEYIVDLNYEEGYCAFSYDVDRNEFQVVTVTGDVGDENYSVKMQEIDHEQVIGIMCFVGLVETINI